MRLEFFGRAAACASSTSSVRGPRSRAPSWAVARAAARPLVSRSREEGEAHVIRNAGGVITDDEIGSLAISQRLLGTEEIILIHHTDCGMLTFTDDDLTRSIQEDTGIKPGWAAEAFPDLDDDVRQSVARIRANPFVPRKDSVRGFVFDVATGKLNEVV
ncbi:beta-class carbonic anhydrase [Pseudonocardia terrae]|uniref:beta-class carbonic anhydrase n=1 Tax=Pseudonocardia terrae TaxID=2905831 RepID=UPI00272E04FD